MFIGKKGEETDENGNILLYLSILDEKPNAFPLFADVIVCMLTKRIRGTNGGK